MAEVLALLSAFAIVLIVAQSTDWFTRRGYEPIQSNTPKSWRSFVYPLIRLVAASAAAFKWLGITLLLVIGLSGTNVILDIEIPVAKPHPVHAAAYFLYCLSAAAFTMVVWTLTGSTVANNNAKAKRDGRSQVQKGASLLFGWRFGNPSKTSQ